MPRSTACSLGTCSTLETIEVDSAGEHLLQVRAIDEAGQVDPTPAERRVHDRRPQRARHGDRVRTRQPDDGPHRHVHVPRRDRAARPAGRDVRVRPRRRRLRAMHIAAHGDDRRARRRRPRPRWSAPSTCAGNADPTPDLYEWLIEGPPDTTAPETIFVAGPPAMTPLFDALVTFTSERGQRRVRVLDRRRAVRGLRGGCRADRAAARRALRRRPGDRPRRQHRPDPGELRVDDRSPARRRRSRRPRRTRARARRRCSRSHRTRPGSRFECTRRRRRVGELHVAASRARSRTRMSSRATAHVPGPRGQRRSTRSLRPHAGDVTWTVGLAPDTTITLAETVIPDPADPALTLRLGFTGADDLTNPIDLEFECRLDTEPFEACSAPVEYDLTELTPGAAPLRGARRRPRRQRRPDAGRPRLHRRADAGHDDPHRARPGRERPRRRRRSRSRRTSRA